MVKTRHSEPNKPRLTIIGINVPVVLFNENRNLRLFSVMRYYVWSSRRYLKSPY